MTLSNQKILYIYSSAQKFASPQHFPIEYHSKQVGQNLVLWKQNASTFQSVMLIQGLELKTKSVVKDYHIRSAFFILAMGIKRVKSLYRPVPIIFQFLLNIYGCS